MMLPFGIERLDEYLGGGLDKDTLNLITGRSGKGKTILASHWAAEGAKSGENVVYISTTLVKRSCENYLKKLKFMEDVYDKIQWRFIRIDSRDFLPMTKEKVDDSMRNILKLNLKDVDRVVFDSVTDFDKALADPVLYRNALGYIAELCHENYMTTIFVEEAPMLQEWGETKNIAESVIFLDLLKTSDGLARAFKIIKKYRSNHPLDWIPFEITGEGIICKEGRFITENFDFVLNKG
jgi:KaiC/GvpD/RAD55 family RecA-like ATPase